VEKTVRKGRTFSTIRSLTQEERVQEIARMLAGVKVTEQAIRHAKELLSRNAA
jgi:DNA repair protein RecN (Recombination protein N)